MTVAALADELLLLIFAPLLTIPREKFTSSCHSTFGENDVVPSSSILSVCKRWLRVATPLLYETIIIRSPGQSRALADVFKQNKAFAKHVKNFRLEGAYPFLADTLPLCTDLRLLVFLLDIYSDAKVASLCKSLPLINPIEVIFYDTERSNDKSRQVFIALSDAIPKWTRLTTFEYPYGQGDGDSAVQHISDGGRTRSDHLVYALTQSPSLCTVYCPVIELSSNAWKRLAARSSIMFKFIYRSKDLPDAYVQNVITTNMKLSASQMEFIDLSNNMSSPPPQAGESSGDVLPLRPGAVEAIADHIWTTILRFATEWYEASDLPYLKCDTERLRQANITRNNVSLVSKRFQKLVLPLIFRTPLIRSPEALAKFSARIFKTPTLGPQVHLLCTSYSRENFRKGPSWQEDLDTQLCALLPHLTGLKHFENRWALSIAVASYVSSDFFTLLARSAGKTLQTINGLTFNCNFEPSAFAAFELFQCLDKLEYHPPPEGFISLESEIRSDALDTLHTLKIPGHTPIFEAFRGLSLSRLTSVSFTSHVYMPLETFFEHSAPNVEHIKFLGRANLAEVLKLVPKLVHMEWFPDHNIAYIEASLSQSAAHDTLEVFSIGNFPEHGIGEKEHNKYIDAFFSSLDFANFPLLKDVRVMEYKWPRDIRDISKDNLPRTAVRIKQAYGIDIKDSSEKPWRPRVQLKG